MNDSSTAGKTPANPIDSGGGTSQRDHTDKVPLLLADFFGKTRFPVMLTMLMMCLFIDHEVPRK
jgi:hypothetical protein